MIHDDTPTLLNLFRYLFLLHIFVHNDGSNCILGRGGIRNSEQLPPRNETCLMFRYSHRNISTASRR
jgi:hypothetical protein